MKITLDLDDLIAKGRLGKDEAERLKGMAVRDAGSLGVNILLAFGVVAVVAAVGVLVPSAPTAMVLGAGLFALSIALNFSGSESWTLLARVCGAIGALLICGGVTYFWGASPEILVLESLGVAVAAVFTRSGLLMALAVLGLGSALGALTSTSDSWWRLLTPSATLSIGIFAVLALALFLASLPLKGPYERLAIIGARTAVLMVNIGFMLGTLFGDLGSGIPSSIYAVVWAIGLVGIGIWGVVVNRPWVVNAAAVFGGVEFFIEWFFYLGANPVSVLGAGILLIVFGIVLFNLNRRFLGPKPAMAGTMPA